MSGSEKGYHFALILNFDLQLIFKLSVALCCSLVAAPVPKIRTLSQSTKIHLVRICVLCIFRP